MLSIKPMQTGCHERDGRGEERREISPSIGSHQGKTFSLREWNKFLFVCLLRAVFVGRYVGEREKGASIIG